MRWFISTWLAIVALSCVASSIADANVWIDRSGRTLLVLSGGNHDFVEVFLVDDTVAVEAWEFDPAAPTNPMRLGVRRTSREPSLNEYPYYREFPLADIDSILIHTSSGDDVVVSQVALDTVVYTGPGNDQLNAMISPNERTVDASLTVYGGSDYDELFGNFRYTEIHGEAGDDVIMVSRVDQAHITGGRWADRLICFAKHGEVHGDDGEDQIRICTTGNMIAHGGPGDDVIDASDSTGKTTQYGGDGDDLLIGGASADTLFGDDDNDMLYGMAEVEYEYNRWRPRVSQVLPLSDDQLDTMTGGAGNDQFYDRFVESVTLYVWQPRTRRFQPVTRDVRWVEEEVTDYRQGDKRIETDLDGVAKLLSS